MEDLQKQARFFKALAHPARLEILEILREGEQCVCHLEAISGYRQAYISQQLTILREAGMVQDRRDGWNVYYRVADPQVFAILDAARQAVGGAPAPSRQAASRKAGRSDCPCPKCNPLDVPREGNISRDVMTSWRKQ
ncbi:MAG: winged helix-turn-helix transcriptional regulator [Chloroflexi bacterium]|nr:winged helix-turn-helix transcriptional regulator [Chloroflexota bacterium]